MIIIGCDFHPSHQQLAVLNEETGEWITPRLKHQGQAVREFYAALPRPVRVGMEATGYAQWFERLLAELGHQLWVGDPAEIRARAVRRQKTDVRDAEHLLELLLSDRFPRIWVPSPSERDTRQLLLHRNQWVQTLTAVKNQLHALAMNQGLRKKSRLWSQAGRQELAALPLGPWAAARRADLLRLLEQLDPRIAELDRAVREQAEQRPSVRHLMQQPGVGPITALAFVLTIGPIQRFPHSRALVSYLGLNPREDSSGEKRRLGAISKQGNPLLRWLLVEAGHSAARVDPQLRRLYLRLKFRRGAGVAKVAVARKLAVKLYWRLREWSEKHPPALPAPMQGSPCTPMTAMSPSIF